MNQQEIIDLIKLAGKERRTIWIIAREADGTVEPREVEPYSFRERSGHILFFGWDVSKSATRSFRLDRIISVEIMDRTFTPRFTAEF